MSPLRNPDLSSGPRKYKGVKSKFDASPASGREALARPSQLDGKSTSSRLGSRARNEDAPLQETHAPKEEQVDSSVEHSLQAEPNLNETKALLNKENNQYSELDVQPPMKERAASGKLADEALVQEHDELQIEDDEL